MARQLTCKCLDLYMLVIRQEDTYRRSGPVGIVFLGLGRRGQSLSRGPALDNDSMCILEIITGLLCLCFDEATVSILYHA